MRSCWLIARTNGSLWNPREGFKLGWGLDSTLAGRSKARLDPCRRCHLAWLFAALAFSSFTSTHLTLLPLSAQGRRDISEPSRQHGGSGSGCNQTIPGQPAHDAILLQAAVGPSAADLSQDRRRHGQGKQRANARLHLRHVPESGLPGAKVIILSPFHFATLPRTLTPSVGA